MGDHRATPPSRTGERAPGIPAHLALALLNRAGTVLTGSMALDETLGHVVRLAVPAIADWCAVLLVGEDGSEQEITSGHPDPEIEATLLAIRRRRRVTGGSESLEVLRSGRSILGTDVTEVAAPDVLDEELAVMARLAARSYLLVPLLARGRVLGAFTLLSTLPGRHYTAADLSFAETLAGRFALAIDNARLHDAASRSLALLDTMFATAPVGLAFLDLGRRYVRVNAALAAMNGRPVEEHLGRSVGEVLGAAGDLVADAHRTVVHSGRPVLEREITTGPASWPDGTGPGSGPGGTGPASGSAGLRHWVCSFWPVHAPDGELLGVSAVVIDNTERRRLLERQREALEAERSARARADLLSRAGAILDSSLDYEETLRNVADIAVPEVADWCAIRMLDEDGRLVAVANAHADPAMQALGRDYEARFPLDPDAPGGPAAVARTGVSQVVREVDDALLEAHITDPDQLAFVRTLGLRSVIVAPLVARRRTFGTLTLAVAESGRRFGDEDVQLAEEVARRAGVAIDNARLYTERSRIAHTLQARLLPERLPSIPGVRLAARYRAAGELNEVGGDFYDVFPLNDGEWALLVGDVSGKGADGAAVTALARYTLRAAALEPGPPSGALHRLNAAMRAEAALSEFVTVALAYVAPGADGELRVRLALGGHPPPMILRADGRVEELAAFGAVLGVVPDPELPDTEAVLGPGDTMVLYTDGVTEAGPRAAPLGEDGLARLLSARAGLEPEALLGAVEEAAVAAQPGEPRDDIALLAVAVEPRRPV